MDNFVADAIFIDAPARRVFSALFDPQEVLVWLDAETATVDAREGGIFSARRADGSSVSGSISVFAADECVEIRDYYHELDGEKRGPMRLGFRLEPQGEGVWITVRQDDLDTGRDWKPFAQETRKEWVRSTVALKRHIEQI